MDFFMVFGWGQVVVGLEFWYVFFQQLGFFDGKQRDFFWFLEDEGWVGFCLGIEGILCNLRARLGLEAGSGKLIGTRGIFFFSFRLCFCRGFDRFFCKCVFFVFFFTWWNVIFKVYGLWVISLVIYSTIVFGVLILNCFKELRYGFNCFCLGEVFIFGLVICRVRQGI